MTSFYKAFEDRFRGSRELISDRLKVYLPLIEPLKDLYPGCKAIDLGCGRGEWLELLRSNGFQSHGVDTDEGMLENANAFGLSTEFRDALEYLKSLPDDSISIVSGFHIAEHLTFKVLQELVKESLRVLKPAGLLILETPNPENISVGSNTFYVDPTHIRPLPPALLLFLPEFYGFARATVFRLNSSITKIINISLLDVINGASPDYSVIGQKNAAIELLSLFDNEFYKKHGFAVDELATHYEQTSHGRQELERLLHDQAQREQAVAEKLEAVRNQAAQREQALRELTSETYRQAQTQAQAHLNTLVQREQAFGQQLQATQEELRHQEQYLAQREAALGQEIAALQTEAQTLHHAQLLQAQQHAAELSTRREEHKRLIEACAALEVQLNAETLSEQQANLRLRQSLAEAQNSLATTHASLTWRMTEPLRALALFITPNKKLISASLIAAEESNAILTATSASQSIAIVQHAAVESTMPPSAPAIKSPAPAIASTLDELLVCHDQYFVQCAYQTLLGRAPDPEGLGYYLGRLRMGISKIRIVAQLRLSKEGKAHAAKLPGLDIAIERHQKEQYPLIGWLFRQRHGGQGNHPTERKLRAIENQLGFLNAECSRHFNQMDAVLAGLQHLLVQQTQSVTAALGGMPMASQDVSSIASAQSREPDGLKQLPPRAKEIYFQLKAAAAMHTGRAV